MLNPNFEGDPVLIKIMQNNSLGNQGVEANSVINMKSIIYYWVLFFLGNVTFFQALFHLKEKTKVIMALYLLISLFSVGFFAMDAFWFKSITLFNLASTLKNFLLTPMFTAIGYLILNYFNWFGKQVD